MGFEGTRLVLELQNRLFQVARLAVQVIDEDVHLTWAMGANVHGSNSLLFLFLLLSLDFRMYMCLYIYIYIYMYTFLHMHISSSSLCPPSPSLLEVNPAECPKMQSHI